MIRKNRSAVFRLRNGCAQSEEAMNRNPSTKFSWCPVCMIHTYHERAEGGWKCRGENHQLYYRERTDPWIQKYKEEQNRKLSPAGP